MQSRIRATTSQPACQNALVRMRPLEATLLSFLAFLSLSLAFLGPGSKSEEPLDESCLPELESLSSLSDTCSSLAFREPLLNGSRSYVGESSSLFAGDRGTSPNSRGFTAAAVGKVWNFRGLLIRMSGMEICRCKPSQNSPTGSECCRSNVATSFSFLLRRFTACHFTGRARGPSTCVPDLTVGRALPANPLPLACMFCDEPRGGETSLMSLMPLMPSRASASGAPGVSFRTNILWISWGSFFGSWHTWATLFAIPFPASSSRHTP
mmetsp:Transcript_32229/g.73700  ORF Transcript_32229/g.73700 Transcript_32229/m.73700 type:complete len:266 (-) Transcript_32229:769-1566(-)